MEGSLQEIQLGGLLRLLTLHRFTGGLHLEDGSRQGVVYLRAGRIQGAHAAPNDRPIGQRLLQAGFVTPSALDEALARQKADPTRRPLGHYLIQGERPAVNPELFRQVLESQTAEHVIELLQFTSGRFHFTEGEQGFTDFPFHLCTEDLILRSFRGLPEKAASDALPPGSAILEWAPRPGAYTLDFSLSGDEWNTLLLFDGDRNLDTVLQLAPKGSLLPVVTVHALLSAGLLKKVRFRFPDLERICRDELGNMGLVLVHNAYQKIGVSRARMGMRELLRILNDLEKSMTLIVGPTRAAGIIETLWEATKR